MITTSHLNDYLRADYLRVKRAAIAVVTEQPFKPGSPSAINVHVSSGEFKTSSGIALCNACQKIHSVLHALLSNAIVEGRMSSHYIVMDYTLDDLHKSADLGCHSCSLLEGSLLAYIRSDKPSTLGLDGEVAVETLLFLAATVNLVDVEKCGIRMGYYNPIIANMGSRVLNFSLANPQIEESTEDDPGVEPGVTPNTGGNATLKMVVDWLKTCSESHQTCEPINSAELGIPRRLLQLNDFNVEIVNNVSQHPYACLSYCWGPETDVPYKLTTMSKSLSRPILSLPATFQDAIAITKYIGIRHLWIDALCIIQDSEQDWLEQSVVMGQIYAHSVITIAALASKDPEGGCFKIRNPLAMRTLRTGHITLEPHDTHSLWQLEADGIKNHVSPLHRRAWVVQERLSAPRTVLFGSSGIYWECRCMQASEFHTRHVDNRTDNLKFMLPNLHAAARSSVGDRQIQSQAREDFIDRWARLVEVYSTCSLTFSSDKLFALAGITRDIEKASGKRFASGLWTDDIATWLLWMQPYVPTDSIYIDIGGRVENSIFPSWSWASTHGRVRHFYSPGTVTWSVKPSIVEGTDEKKLKLTTWKRKVVAREDFCIALVSDGSNRGDLNEDHVWYCDERKVDGIIGMEILLIQRVSVSQQLSIEAVRCLVVTCVDQAQKTYRRLGMTIIRFNTLKDDPFPRDASFLCDENEIMLV